MNIIDKKMKKIIILLLLAAVSIKTWGQTNSYLINLNVTYGIKPHSPYDINGSFEGIELEYRKNINYDSFTPPKFLRYWEIQVWNTDLEHLTLSHDTATTQAFGMEFGIAGGIGLGLLKTKNISVVFTPQLGGVYDTQNTDRSHYANNIIVTHFNPVARGILRIDYKMIELSVGDSYQYNPLINSHTYFNKIWFGIGMTQ